MSSSVNQASNKRTKENDVNRKLQLYGIICAFQAGKAPSNEQIRIALNSLNDSRVLSDPSPDLSPETLNTISDLQNVIEQVKILLLTKNEGNLLQDFIWQSRHVHLREIPTSGIPFEFNSARTQAVDALEGIRTLGTLIISNGQFRKLLKDTSIILRDITSDTAQKAVNFVNPSNEEMMQVDDAAASSTWHDIPRINGGKLKETLRSSTSGRNAFRPATSSSQGGSIQSESGFNVRIPGNDMSDVTDDSPHNSSDVRAGGFGKLDKTRSYLSGKLPPQRREKTIFRIKKLIVECQEHPDYHTAITMLLDLAATYAGHINKISDKGTGIAKSSLPLKALKCAKYDLKIIIERFANGTSLNELFDSINDIYIDADKDPNLRLWFRDANTYLRKCLKDEGYIMSTQANENWDFLFQKGSFLFRDRYRHHTDRIFGEITFLADQFDHDPVNQKFSKAIEKLFNDLGKDKNGKPTFKPQILKDLTEIFVPALLKNIRYVPIPRIEYADRNVDLVIENLILESDNFFPNDFEITNDNYFLWGRDKAANRSKHSVSVHVSGVQMDLKDISYYLKKKRGFPTIKDSGLIDIFLGGTGFSFSMKMSTCDSKDRQNFFKISQVDVDVKNLKIKIKKSKHKVLLNIVKPILQMIITPIMQKALEKNIMDKALWLDSLIYQIKVESDRIAEEAKGHPEKTTSIYQLYFKAFRNKFRDTPNAPHHYIPGGTVVNMAITEHDFIFSDIHLPGGVSAKALFYKDVAINSSKNWESSIFNLGSATSTGSESIA
ncbi:hypothetical protein K3495_g8621 [Podosphaera aphanis]|nr:hypothetical protein K3495_g8621 [Podosphaera aphanis]